MNLSVSRAGLPGLLLAACLAACAGEEPAQRTDAERDSLIGESGLPGAAGVRGALDAADSARARVDRVDALADSVP